MIKVDGWMDGWLVVHGKVKAEQRKVGRMLWALIMMMMSAVIGRSSA